MGLQQVEAAAATSLVTVDQVKSHCSIETNEWDTLLTGFIAAAIAHVENVTGRALGTQDWQLTLDAFEDEIRLPIGPVQGVSSVSYIDEDRFTQSLPPDVYIEDLLSSQQRLVRDPQKSWPQTASVPNAVTVTFSTGYVELPAPISQAVLMLVAFWFENRSSVNVGNIVNSMPFSVELLLQPYRKMVL